MPTPREYTTLDLNRNHLTTECEVEPPAPLGMEAVLLHRRQPVLRELGLQEQVGFRVLT